MTRVDTDFPNYYTSAKILIEGKDVSRIYDDNWFQGTILQYGMNQLGKFSPYPPVTSFVMTPLAFLSPINALRVWTVINIGLLALGIGLLTEITGKSWLWSTLLFLLSGHALINNFRFGQFYLVLTVLILSGYRYWRKGEHTISGCLFGLGAAIKYFPILFFLEFLARREWKILIAGGATVVLVTFVGFLLLGKNVYHEFFFRVLGPHLTGNIQDPFTFTFQSWNSLFKRLFIYHSTENPNPLIRVSSLYSVALWSVYCSVLSLLAAAYYKLGNRSKVEAPELQFALLGITGLLLLPASATYHFLLLILPVALFLRSEKWTSQQKGLAFLYGIIGFIPYSLLGRFDTDGIFAILAYPRLILMSALFAVTIAIAWSGQWEFAARILHPSSVKYDHPA